MSHIDPNDDDDAMDPNMVDMDPEQFEDWGDQPVEQRHWAGHPRPPVRPPVGWQPGFPPPGTRPPFGPHPPLMRPPGPGKWPFWGYWGYRMLAAWRDIKFLKKLVGEIVEEDILKAIEMGIIAPGPNSPVPGPGGGTGTGGVIVSPTPPANPAIGQVWYDTSTDQVKFWNGTAWIPFSVMQGVTDGSDAAPGIVGEFLVFTATGSYDTNQGPGTGALASPGILPPGDWDVQASVYFGDKTKLDAANCAQIQGANLSLRPVPPGFSSDMFCMNYAWSGIGDLGISTLSLQSPSVRASVSVPTLLPIWIGFNDIVSDASALRPGIWTLTVTARRRR